MRASGRILNALIHFTDSSCSCLEAAAGRSTRKEQTIGSVLSKLNAYPISKSTGPSKLAQDQLGNFSTSFSPLIVATDSAFDLRHSLTVPNEFLGFRCFDVLSKYCEREERVGSTLLWKLF
jgi:hypothetical protein